MPFNERSATRPVTQRFDTIDLLRGLSIIAVVLLHLYIRFSFSPSSSPTASRAC